MKEKISAPKGESGKPDKRQQYPNTQAPTDSKLPDSGITQPHSAKKVALGPNTNR